MVTDGNRLLVRTFNKENKMRRFLYVLLLLIICAPVFAGGVGYVNYDKVVENYQYAKTSLREIETKNNEIQQFLMKKEEKV